MCPLNYLSEIFHEKRLKTDNDVEDLFCELDTLAKQVLFLSKDNETKGQMYDYLLKETFKKPVKII